MNRSRLILASAFFYRRTHLGIVGGAAVAAAVIVGALLVGDSVDASLKDTALKRLGKVHLAAIGDQRFIRHELAAQLSEDFGSPVAAVLKLTAVADRPDGAARASNVSVIGVDEQFWRMSHDLAGSPTLAPGQVAVNEPLVAQLGIGLGDDVVLRMDKPGALSRDLPLGHDTDASVVLRAQVAAIVGARQLGLFSLTTKAVPAYNAFVSRGWLQTQLNQQGRANGLLVGAGVTVERAQAQLKHRWRLADAQLELRELPDNKGVELRSRRVFLDSSMVEKRRDDDAHWFLTYFVNELRVNDRAAPYSMVTATDANTPDLQDDQIIINQWLADDLRARVGDELELAYYVMADDNRLDEKHKRFTVRRIDPITGLAADRTLMPDFPGLADAEHCRDWQPGIPIALDRIREKDERYWQQYRGTPKAFVTLRAGQAMWANRFGNLTAMRFSVGPRTVSQIQQRIEEKLDPRDSGFAFENVRSSALRATDEAIAFGPLFLALSVFLLAAAVLLTAMMFVLGVDQRAGHIGTLLALGWSPMQVRRLLLTEGAVLSIVGAAIGTAAGLAYTRGVLAALATIWRDAVADAAISFHARPMSLALGGLAAVVVAMLSIWWTLRRLGQCSVQQLLAQGRIEASASPRNRRTSSLVFIMACSAILVAVLLIFLIQPQTGQSVSLQFFGSAALVLFATLGFTHVGLSRTRRPTGPQHMGMRVLNLAGVMRRRGRSLATVALLACGVFMVIAVGANRLSSPADPADRHAGTGGFTLIGRSTLPVTDNVKDPATLGALLDHSGAMEDIAIVPFRVREGDDASCLNLNRAQHPRLLGVAPHLLADRGAFRFAKSIQADGGDEGWRLLEQPVGPDDPLPAIADQATVRWALGKAVGDTIAYTDERGNRFEVRIVAALDGSILQGNIIISERALLKRFASTTGYRLFLVDSPWQQVDTVRADLSQALQDVGLELTRTVDRLAQFNAVQNTYLAIFQALGALALVLGTVGLAMVVLRNLLERRAELALLGALGFTRRQVRRLVIVEHLLLLVIGMSCGVAAALVALIPVIRLGAFNLPASALTVILVFITGLLSVRVAAGMAMRAPMLQALRSE